jgi:S-adenosylmethionine-diacylgycerolhomoserine-N-methlytransferase
MMRAAEVGTAERMDHIYAPQRLIYDMTRRHYLLGRVGLVRGLRPPPGGHVLEIACGTAWNLIRAADLYPDAQFYGLDVSSAMLETARRSIARRGLHDRITVAQADATCFDPFRLFGRCDFDRVFISYALSMMPSWAGALEQAAGAVAEDGALHVLDFGQCEELPAAVRSLLFRWLARFSVTPIPDLANGIKHIAVLGRFEVVTTQLHRGYAVSAELHRAPRPVRL